ncbi:MAG TPA: phosphate regulon sensor histidine kinase PhoR [Chromatiales bacterium]|nr:phosphate regulon sensor histidine kinase PhoR [Thiotrichales bacterium]HIP68645.1 phosphate regulon sensor histidine kinase PhoR [Chromatiales bacterium]
MGDAWSAEYWRLGLVFIAVLMIGLLTGNWYVAWILPLTLYIAWHLRQLYFLESWLRKGTKTKKAPESGGVWALIVQQIYRRKQQERVQKKRLASTLSRFNATASALPDGTVVLNKAHEIEWANQAASELLGIDRKRDPGLRIETLIRTPEFHQWMNSGKKGKDLEMISPVDQNRTLVLRRVKFGKGQFLLTARDISQRIQLQQMRKAFVANASHELRTPLTVIAGYLEILENADDLPDALREPVINANTQARRMRQIIEDLLTLSQLEAEDLAERNGKKLNVPALLEQFTSDLQKTLALDTHTLKLDVDSGLKIRAVESEFTSLALNLIKNAIRHTPAGTTIRIGWKKNSTGEACLSVKDDGPGIEAEHIPKLTERFYRVDPGRSRETGGTGLGLSIVKHVMQRHGGRLVIQSARGKGSIFTACFPQYRTLS